MGSALVSGETSRPIGGPEMLSYDISQHFEFSDTPHYGYSFRALKTADKLSQQRPGELFVFIMQRKLIHIAPTINWDHELTWKLLESGADQGLTVYAIVDMLAQRTVPLPGIKLHATLQNIDTESVFA